MYLQKNKYPTLRNRSSAGFAPINEVSLGIPYAKVAGGSASQTGQLEVNFIAKNTFCGSLFISLKGRQLCPFMD